VELKFHQLFSTMTEAIGAEKQIKGWSRAKKQALIAGDFDLLRELARSKPSP
jgi:predicted GIY-YIG superfamily endonuclease